MNEKEIGKPKRKKKVSEADETPVVKKSAKSRKAAETKIELKEAAPVAEVKPVKKTGSVKKAPAQVRAEITASEGKKADSEAAAPALAETPNLIESPTEETAAPKKKPRARKLAAAKPALDSSATSPVKKKAAKAKQEDPELKEAIEPAAEIVETEKPAEETATGAEAKRQESPIFKELAEPKLPALPQENRARLQMQSPNRIFFYWSVKHNPFETLNRAFRGRAARYTLTVKLVNLDTRDEQVYPVEPSGSWWFSVDQNTNYRAEVGFFAENRPFVRLMYSNSVQTPRLAPSPNTDWSTDFVVTSEQFAEVLDASGYAQDAVEVALAGDDRDVSDRATQNAFVRLVGKQSFETDSDELRSVLLALAAGAALESLRAQISASLFARLEAILSENAERLSAEKVLAALKENFEFEDDAEEILSPVFGASVINFPRKPRFPKFSPVSSFK